MEKSFITIGGKEYRVEVNWNALGNFLSLVGDDSIGGLTKLEQFRVTHITSLVAACVKEGERLEGREVNLDPLKLGETFRLSNFKDFRAIYNEQSRAWLAEDAEPAKKNEEQQTGAN